MNKKIISFTVALCFCAFFGVSRGLCDAVGGTRVFEFLKIDVPARPASMGGAFVAIADDVNAVRYNPAGLGLLDENYVSFSHNEWFEGVRQNYLAFSHISGFGGYLNYLDYGVIGETTVSNPRGLGSGDFRSYDVAAAVGYGASVSEKLSLGLSLKYVRQVISVYDAWALSSDIGCHYITPVERLSAGVVLQNISTKASFLDTKEELPLIVKAGLGYRFADDKALVGVDISRQMDSERLTLNFGGEWKPVDFAVFRAGVNTRNDLDTGITAGVGFNHRKFSVDYAYSPYGDLGRTHQITVTYRFGLKKSGSDKGISKMNAMPAAPPVPDVPAVADLKKIDGLDIKEEAAVGSDESNKVSPSPSRITTITAGESAVHFALNSAGITNFDALDKIAGVILKNPAYKVDIVGHTDSIGEKQYNVMLSLRRAENVMRYLTSVGVGAGKISVRGVGYSRPLVPDDTPENQAKNRRVEIILQE